MMNDTAPKAPMTVDYGLLLMRLMLGIVFMFHGSQKLFGMFEGMGIQGFAGYLEGMKIPMPQVSAYAAAIAELGGGACVLVGLLTRLAVIPMIITMAVAFIVAHKAKFYGEGNGEHALTLGVMLLTLMLTGAGRFSIDGIFRKPSYD
jgi:putative oxidoreductase